MGPPRNAHPRPRRQGGGRSSLYAERRGIRGEARQYAAEWSDAAAQAVFDTLHFESGRLGAGVCEYTGRVLQREEEGIDRFVTQECAGISTADRALAREIIGFHSALMASAVTRDDKARRVRSFLKPLRERARARGLVGRIDVACDATPKDTFYKWLGAKPEEERLRPLTAGGRAEEGIAQWELGGQVTQGVVCYERAVGRLVAGRGNSAPLESMRREPTDSALLKFRRIVYGIMVVAAGEKVPEGTRHEGAGGTKKFGAQWADGDILEELLLELAEAADRLPNAEMETVVAVMHESLFKATSRGNESVSLAASRQMCKVVDYVAQSKMAAAAAASAARAGASPGGKSPLKTSGAKKRGAPSPAVEKSPKAKSPRAAKTSKWVDEEGAVGPNGLARKKGGNPAGAACERLAKGEWPSGGRLQATAGAVETPTRRLVGAWTPEDVEREGMGAAVGMGAARTWLSATACAEVLLPRGGALRAWKRSPELAGARGRKPCDCRGQAKAAEPHRRWGQAAMGW
ncbi:hypothetical protein AB1Y20_002597 [Prymnesium parvum]|uniref:Uncharacterized protein n=1 Tax=Prymnesium parvum TaxID=97485 RepID=A0AB34J9I5_PRYPA